MNAVPQPEPLWRLRQAPLKVLYDAQDTAALSEITPAVRSQQLQVWILLSQPLPKDLPEALAPLLEAAAERSVKALISSPSANTTELSIKSSVGRLFKPYRHKHIDFRWAKAPLPQLPLPVNGVSLLLQEAAPAGDTALLFANSAEATAFKACWSWGDPTQRAQSVLQHTQATWTNSATVPVLPAWDDVSLDTSGYIFPEMYPHQLRALKAWEGNHFRGIFEMCTGAGKTVAALAGTLLLQQRLQSKAKTISAIVILCPKRVLVDQWHRELSARGFRVAAIVYDNPQQYLDQLDTALRDTKPRYIISTYDSFALPRFQALLKSAAAIGRRGLLIADEMHWCASADRRACLRNCAEYFPWRLGLSATPKIEDDESVSNQLEDYFGTILEAARYDLKAALNDGVLCPYRYHPVPAFLDPKTSAKYLDILQRTSTRSGRIDLAAYSERRKILRKGDLQLKTLETICDGLGADKSTFDHTLVYCPPGQDYDDAPEEDGETIPLINKIKLVFQNRQILCTSILAETTDREHSLSQFESATVSILLAIGCLDEGMDVPSTRRAIMLYSVDRLRQFVQRRGRVLRKFEGKKVAEIIDLIVLPHNADMPDTVADGLLRKELRRYTEFATLALNSAEAQLALDTAIRTATRRTR
jgi:superfamily II DNA or RNA helicase